MSSAAAIAEVAKSVKSAAVPTNFAHGLPRPIRSHRVVTMIRPRFLWSFRYTFSLLARQ
jgi:hypothetical protein